MRHLIWVVLIGCGAQQGTSSDPVLSGNTCSLHTSATTCQMEMDCTWLGTGCACPPNDPTCTCSEGTCASTSGSGSGSGSGSSGTGCACPNGGVCYEQIGGPAQQSGTEPQIECTTPTAGTGDPCTRIAGEGTCRDSPTVSGLCVCDNGIR